ncbi:MAG: DegV family protein [Bilifractor sp.]|jgi:DegV family protein with EDD domain
MKTAIMTDTNSGISVDEGRSLGIYVIPMPVIIDDQDFLEHVNITHQQTYEAILAGKDVRTSQPSPDTLINTWKDILKKDGYDAVVYIPMSSGLSNSCETALAFARDFDGKVQVVDNHRISVTLRQSVLEAKDMADAGKDAKEIRRHLEKTGGESSIYIAVNTLDLLKKNGRATPAAAALSAVFNIKPILTIQGGKLDAFAKVRGIKHCESRICKAVQDDVNNRFSDIEPSHLYIGAAGTFQHQEDADHWLATVRENFPDCNTFYDPLSCSIACHVSVDAIGIGICYR